MIITPEPGRHKDIGRQLLELADSPRDVQWVTWPVAGYSIPMYLFSRFAVAEPDVAGQALQQLPLEQLEQLAEQAPAPRRRGRPRKETSTDDTATSPEEE